MEATVEGIDVGGFFTAARKLEEGTLFSKSDVARGANVCVISRSLHRRLFPDGPRLGAKLRINHSTFTLVGVVDDARAINPLAPSVADLRAYMPFTSLLRRIDPTAEMSIAVQARTIEAVDTVQRDLSDLMEQQRKGRKAVFRTSNSFDSIKTYFDSSVTVTRMLATIGGISLLVGGIGIMNIMLASVSERTREIGIRMALGTRPITVLSQFLAEATTLCLIGSTIGIAIGVTASWIVNWLNDWPIAIAPGSVAGAIVCCLLVGAVFGYAPASRAARMNPVDALLSI